MMKLYLETKEAYKDCILFYRLGDFYEMFFDDAILVSKELELTLTGKNCGMEERAPMCGVPYHAADTYISRLIEKGHKVAICEQVEDPKQAKGLVKREVIRVVTPGTVIDMESLDDSRNNYIMCIVCMSDRYGLSYADITTGEFKLTEISSLRKVTDEIHKLMPKEIVCNEAFSLGGVDTKELQEKLQISLYVLESWYFDDDGCKTALKDHFHVNSMDGFGLKDYELGTIAAGALLQYLFETQKNSLDHMRMLNPYDLETYMLLDASSRRNLELTETIRDKQKRGSLLWVLDKTKTAMGSRMLRNFIEQPLLDKRMITERLNAVEAFVKHAVTREEMREYLDAVYDLERLMTRVSYHSVTPRDMIALKQSMGMLPHIRELLKDLPKSVFSQIYEELDPLQDLYLLIDEAIDDDPPLTVRDGGLIKEGYNETVDELRNAKTEGKNWLAALEAETKESTGIKNLRIKYNRVFGYYFEVTNSFKDLVPADFIRKQTLTNAERYTTEALKELEDKILNAEDKLFTLEYDLFSKIREQLSSQIDRIQKSAHLIALLDCYASLAKVSEQNRYVRPKLNEKGVINIKGGRHPVIEKISTQDLFVPNDTYLDNSEHLMSIITGPNMAGKSTYMRQTALIVLMAQIGCFVPADSADIGIVDRIFTRVGASDDLSSGQSTFMVEMSEVANILRNATNRSLLILDEIGRGTSTFDGLSIAWAVIEYISNTKLVGAKTLFATHYHELTELEGTVKGLNNYCIAVKEQGDQIVFLRKIIRGGADKSYGIQVAKLAGVPDPVIERAKELASQLDQNDIARSIQIIAAEDKGMKKADEVDLNQISLFDTVKEDDIIEEIKRLDIDHLTPMEALNTLAMLQSRLKNRW
ncbi:MAG: DNA mismatch repair protein MutS [Lachnospiraceae bacterium]|nr:DNA mismatch repair protein MutS [Lachnospiraceae bacterium]